MGGFLTHVKDEGGGECSTRRVWFGRARPRNDEPVDCADGGAGGSTLHGPAENLSSNEISTAKYSSIITW